MFPWCRMARTPGSFSAAAVSSFTTFPFAIFASTGTPYSIPGKWKSAVYCARPLTFSGPSTRTVSRPIGEVVDFSCVVGIFTPLVESGLRGHLQSVRQASLCQFDLESVLALRFCLTHRGFRGFAEVGFGRRLTGECRFGF